MDIKRVELKAVPSLKKLSYLTSKRVNRILFYSSGLDSDHGRYSILVLNPLEQIKGDVVKTLFEFDEVADMEFPIPIFSGFFSYEFMNEFKNSSYPENIKIPEAFFICSDSFLVVDNFEKRAALVVVDASFSKVSMDERIDEFLKELDEPVPEISYEKENLRADAQISKETYLKSIDEIRRLIGEGDVYQVNFTYPVKIKTRTPSWVLFEKYLSKNHVDYAVYFNCEDVEVLSISPECLLKFENFNKISSFPIKGTIKKTADETENNKLQKELENSEKDRAELAMIVDLVRNDIGKVAQAGSVNVDFHAKTMEFPTLFHLYSSVSGFIEKDRRAELFTSIFPGGSITGAPKESAMRIIGDLEKYRRNIYTGAIGFVGLNGKTVFNIPIRTVQRVGDTLIYSTGGGITWKSDPESEFEETLVKLKAFLNIFDDVKIKFW